MKNENAYWISPDSEIIPVEISHIQKVLQMPRVFSLSKGYLEEKYKEHNEKVGLEGKGREEIMTTLLNEGWVRIRLKSRPDYWIIQLKSYSQQEIRSIKKWAKLMLKNKYVSLQSEIRIYRIEETEPIVFLFGALLD